jgi:hypothetical protein
MTSSPHDWDFAILHCKEKHTSNTIRREGSNLDIKD